MKSTDTTTSRGNQSPRLLPKPAPSATKSNVPVITPKPCQQQRAADNFGSNEKGNGIKTEFESKFGVRLRKGAPGSPGPSSGSRNSGHAPTTALRPKSDTKPTVLLSQARGPIATHFDAKAQGQENTRLGDIVTGNTDQSQHTNVPDDHLQTTLSSQAGASIRTKRPSYVNLDFGDEEPETVLHKARVVYDFKQAEEGEISIITGQKVEVLKDDVSGWSFIRTEDSSQGWCPANYIVKCGDSTEDSDDDHNYQNEDFSGRRPPISDGITGASANVQERETEKPKFEISDITKVKLMPTASKSADTGAVKSVFPVKPTKALKPPIISKKPEITLAKPTKEKPSISAKPKLNSTKNTESSSGGASVQKLAKAFNQK